MIVTERTRTIAAHLTRVWDVLADFDRLAVWADNADHTCWLDEPSAADVDGGDMVGRARRVQAGRVVLVERITVWEPPARLAYDLGGLPPVVKTAVNEWRLRPIRRTASTPSSRWPPMSTVGRDLHSDSSPDSSAHALPRHPT